MLVVPVGRNTQYDKQFQIIARLQELPLNDLTRPTGWTAPQNFRYSRLNTGSLTFDYLKPSDIQARGYDKLKVLKTVVNVISNICFIFVFDNITIHADYYPYLGIN